MSNEEQEQLLIKYIRLDEANKYIFRDNAKMHDMGALVASFEKYGFRDAPAFDMKLQDGGGIHDGNGRIEALTQMYNQKRKPPRGILVDETDKMWCVPIQFGIDSESEARARALTIDMNNIGMSGGDFTAVDMSRMWDTKTYMALLQGLSAENEEPVSVDKDTIERLARVFNSDESGDEDKKDDESQDVVLIVIECDSEDERLEIMAKLKVQGIKSRSYSGTMKSKLSLKS
jgi:hypothetical protein